MKAGRNWLIGGVVLALLLVAGGWFLLVSPKRSEASDVRAQTSQVRARNDQLRADLRTLNEQKTAVTQKQALIAAVGREVPDDAQTAALLRTLRRAADDAGVKLTSVTPSAPTAATSLYTGSAPYAAISLDMVVTGDYSTLKLFLSNVEGQQRVIVPVTVSLTPTTKDATGIGLTDILNMTVSARTYTTDTASITPAQLPGLATTAATPSASSSPSAS